MCASPTTLGQASITTRAARCLNSPLSRIAQPDTRCPRWRSGPPHPTSDSCERIELVRVLHPAVTLVRPQMQFIQQARRTYLHRPFLPIRPCHQSFRCAHGISSSVRFIMNAVVPVDPLEFLSVPPHAVATYELRLITCQKANDDGIGRPIGVLPLLRSTFECPPVQ